MSVIPEGVKLPADHKSPAQAEAEGATTVDVAWRGLTFAVASDPDDWDVATLLAFEEGKAASGVRSLLGKKQWAKLVQTKPKTRDLGDLFGTIATALGLDAAGE